MKKKVANDIEADGRNVNQSRDPPGQRSVYIPPGMPERESYRLSTFKDYPSNVPVDPRQFASHGFQYTGYKDRVKCFCCGQACENWMVGDDISLPRWHRDDCQFTNGTDTSNVPIGTFFQTHLQGHTRPNNPPPRQLQDHINLNRQTSISAARENDSQLPENDSHPSSLFPCLHPVNPHMRSTEARLQTFRDNANIWPAHRIRATPQEIVDAGFFYLGERDRAKCWYCNGGLQNWERDDNPWEEHAKWFPMCEYVLQRQGAEYIHGIVSRFPNLRRPTLFNPTLAMSSHRASRLLQERHRASLNLPTTSSSPVIIDPREELRRREKKIEEEMSSSELVANAKIMGFEDRIIKEALKRQYERHNDMFSNFESFVDAMQSISDLPDASVDELSSPSGEGHSLSNGNPSTSDDFLEMQRLQEDRICKVCRREIACMVFIPCGHLACCLECGKQAAKCPICKVVIKEKVRSYLS